MAHRIPAPLRAVGTLLRALLGLALLTALVGGVPYLLLKVGHQPYRTLRQPGPADPAG